MLCNEGLACQTPTTSLYKLTRDGTGGVVGFATVAREIRKLWAAELPRVKLADAGLRVGQSAATQAQEVERTGERLLSRAG